ncbi:MAG: polysaccharide deacetylase family protein [Bryobacteraceae bacterium]|nr:polysaccharide deacetylase family protein [Bryobacteraceae bacterium]
MPLALTAWHGLKRWLHAAAEGSGLNAALLGSEWRRRRLLILCYHGVSLRDEHEWDPALYVSPERFARRMEVVADAGCAVLPLGPALEMLREGTLPPRAVCITFDDGFHDFHARALPVLAGRGWPSTVYLTTYYSQYNVPVFNPTLRYLLWRGRGERLWWPETGIFEDVLDARGREEAAARVHAYCGAQGLGGYEKNQVLRALAFRLGIDWDEVLRARILQLMNAGEVRDAAAKGVRIEMHGHRHTLHRHRGRFLEELDENREAITALTGVAPRAYCYPGGYHLPEFEGWLAERGITSATTCNPGLAGADVNLWELPRFVDTSRVSEAELRGWLSGFAEFVPRQHEYGDATQLAPEGAPARRRARAAAAAGA